MAHIGVLSGRLAAHCNDLGTMPASHATSTDTAARHGDMDPGVARATQALAGLDGAADPP